MIKKVLIAFGMLTVLAIAGAVGFEQYYAEQMLPGITIDGHSLAGQNQAGAREQLLQSVRKYEKDGLTFAVGNQTVHASYADMGMHFDIDTAIDRAYSTSHSTIPGQGTLTVLLSLITGHTVVPLPLIVDQKIEQQYIDNTLHATFSKKPVDATLHITESSVDVLPDQSGTWVLDDQLKAAIITSVIEHSARVAVPVETKPADVIPSALTTAKTEAEAFFARKIVLSAADKKVVPSRTELADWLLIDPSGDTPHAKIDGEKVKNYLTQVVARKVNQHLADQLLDPNEGVIKAGSDGIVLKVDDSVTAIMDAIQQDNSNAIITLAVDVKNKSSITVDPQDGSTPGRVENKYIEINLSKQRLYLYEGQTFVNSFRVSTGKWSTPTPTGTFAIANKMGTAYSNPYDLYMPKWNGLSGDSIKTGEYGIHGLPYRGNWIEGEGHIGTPVSHGCIRLGKGNDQYVYDWATLGTPVFIH